MLGAAYVKGTRTVQVIVEPNPPPYVECCQLQVDLR